MLYQNESQYFSLPSSQPTDASHADDVVDGSSIGYLVSEYPTKSHTFIRREIEALRMHGLPVRVFSIRRPPPESGQSASYRAAFEETWYVLPASVATMASLTQ